VERLVVEALTAIVAVPQDLVGVVIVALAFKYQTDRVCGSAR
jgi:hypothetical protein